jgi:tetratricopeptide (TPR) repeat protein
MRPVRWLPSLLVLLASFVAAAAPAATDLERAKAHYEAGSGLYQLGRYDEAMHEFSAGYALSHRPQFALNIAQCYRMLGRYEEARDMIRRFLDEAPADAPERPSATRLLAETEAQIRAQGTATPPPVLEPPPAATKPPPPIAVTAPAATKPPPPPRRSHRAAYIALGVTGAVLVVGAAVAIGLVVAFPTETVPSTSLGSVRF